MPAVKALVNLIFMYSSLRISKEIIVDKHNSKYAISYPENNTFTAEDVIIEKMERTASLHDVLDGSRHSLYTHWSQCTGSLWMI